MNNPFGILAKRLSGWLGLLLVGGALVSGCQTSNNDISFSSVPPDLFAGETGTPAGTPNNPSNHSSTNPGGPSGAANVASNPSEFADRFAIGDMVRVTFSGTSQTELLQPHEERIKDDGTITLPYIGAVKAVNRTPGDLQKDIHDRYVPDYYKRLTVVVTSDRRVYYVGGQVKLPGRQEYIGTTTVTKAIQSAGDFTDFANRKKVRLTRADGSFFTVNCIKAAKDPSLDLPVYPGDKIEVVMRGIWD